MKLDRQGQIDEAGGQGQHQRDIGLDDGKQGHDDPQGQPGHPGLSLANAQLPVFRVVDRHRHRRGQVQVDVPQQDSQEILQGILGRIDIDAQDIFQDRQVADVPLIPGIAGTAPLGILGGLVLDGDIGIVEAVGHRKASGG
jgi:hypothetical protein